MLEGASASGDGEDSSALDVSRHGRKQSVCLVIGSGRAKTGLVGDRPPQRDGRHGLPVSCASHRGQQARPVVGALLELDVKAV